MLGLTSYEGSVQVLGEDPYRHRARLMKDVAFISDVASLPRFLKVRELFRMLSDIHPNFSAEKAQGFLDGTDVKLGALIANLSKGMTETPPIEADLNASVATADPTTPSDSAKTSKTDPSMVLLKCEGRPLPPL